MGSLKEGTIQAENRRDALQRLNQQGYVVLSILEGIGNNHTKKHYPFSKIRKYGFILTVLFFILFSINYLLDNRSEKVSSTVVKQEPKIAQNAVAKINKKFDVQHQHAITDSADQFVPLTNGNKESYSVHSITNNFVIQNTAPTNTTNTVILKMKSEKLMLMLSGVRQGRRLPPAPITPAMTKDFSAATTNNIFIDDNESERHALRKEDVAWMKVDVADMVKKGYTPEEIFKVIQDDHNARALAREQLLLHAKLLWHEGKEQEYSDFMENANTELQKIGIDPIKVNEIDRKMRINQ